MEDTMSFMLAGLVGFALAAACGMRVFAPLAILSIASHFGWIALGGGFSWLGSTPAMVCFVAACVIEAVGMLVPVIDHALDVAAAPVAAVAGTLVMATQLATSSGVDTSIVPPWATWALAAVVGGGVATGVHFASAAVRAGSTASTGGILNPIYSLLETAASMVVAVLAVVVPILAVILAFVVVAGIVVAAWVFYRVLKNAKAKVMGGSIQGTPARA